MKRYEHVLQLVFGQPWMIRPEMHDTIASVVRLRAEGGALSDDEIRARLTFAAGAAGPRGGARTMGAVGIIPIYGAIFPRANLMTEFSGGATVASIRQAFRQVLADESVGSILFDIDSPGGMADGIEELATEIREARGQKPMAAIGDYWMASAAYYLGSQADEIVASPSSMIGWIGTVLTHIEYSKANEMDGITATIIRNPPGKFGGNSMEPLSEQALEEFQRQVDDFTGQFEAAVAKGRGVSVATVRRDFGQGGGMSAARAKAAGLVNRVATFDETVQRLATGKVVPRGTGARAEGGYVKVVLTGQGNGDDGVYSTPADRLAEMTADLDGGPGPAEPGEQAPDDTSGLEPVAVGAESAGDQDALELLRLKHRARTR